MEGPGEPWCLGEEHVSISVVAEFPQGLVLVADTRVTKVELWPRDQFHQLETYYEETSHKISELTDWAGCVAAGDRAFADSSLLEARAILQWQPPRNVRDLLAILREVFSKQFCSGGHMQAEFLVGTYHEDVSSIHHLFSPSFDAVAKHGCSPIGYLTPELEERIQLGYELALRASESPAAIDPLYLARILTRPFVEPSIMAKAPQSGKYLIAAGLDHSGFRYGTLEVTRRDGTRHYRTLPVHGGALIVDFVERQVWPVPGLADSYVFAATATLDLDIQGFESILRTLGVHPEGPIGVLGGR